jgi:hypothetical protein
MSPAPSPRPSSPGVPPRLHPWDRERLTRFREWEDRIRAAPYGGTVPDAVGFLRSVDPPTWMADQLPAQRLFALFALPEPLGSAPLIVLPPRRHRRLEEGLVHVRGLRKIALMPPGRAVGVPALRATDSPTPVSWVSLEAKHPTGPGPLSELAELGREWSLPDRLLEDLALGVVGAPPWHGRPPELNVFFGAEGWSLRHHRTLLARLLDAAPPAARRPRTSRKRSAAAIELPPGVMLRSAGSVSPTPPRLRVVPLGPLSFRSLGSATAGRERSTFLYGRSVPADIPEILGRVHLPVWVSGPEPREGFRRWEMEGIRDSLRVALWSCRWTQPDAPDTPEWVAWWRAESPRLTKALEELANAAPRPWGDEIRRGVTERSLSARLAQVSLACARLRGAAEVERRDLKAAVSRWLASVELLTERARGPGLPWTRGSDRSRSARGRRSARAVLAILARASDGLSLDEIVAAARDGSPELSPFELETVVERLRVRGALFEDVRGRFHPV